MNSLDNSYKDLLRDILENGTEKKDRTGTGTISVFGRQIRHKMSEGFPLLTTKKMAWKTLVTELLWFLRGSTNIKFLVDNRCHIWDGDAYKNYCKVAGALEEPDYDIHVDDPNQNCTRLMTQEEFINKIKTDDEFAKKWGELGPIYGRQWRNWTLHSVGPNDSFPIRVDQIKLLIEQLKSNPDSRRLMVNAWNVGELDEMVLPPCHYGFQVWTRELSLEERLDLASKTYDVFDPLDFSIPAKVDHDEIDKLYPVPKRAISLMWNQRSVDTFLGLPFNIASYGLLLEIIAKLVNMVPDELIGNLGDVHIYSNHVEQAKEQIGRKYTPEERQEMLKEAMSWRLYNKAVNELMPFGGGMSEYYDSHKIPYRTREPYPLPELKHIKTDDFYKSLSNDMSLFTHLDNTDFVIENYESHPTIKAPLSN
jgi:thymidylate synthase